MDNNLQFKISLIDSAGKVVKNLTGRLENLDDTVGKVQRSIKQTSDSLSSWTRHFLSINQFTQAFSQLSSALNDLAAPAADFNYAMRKMNTMAGLSEGDKNKQEKEKFDKEHAMCLTLAKANYIVDYRESVEGEFDIYLDGKKADLKKAGSHNNIVKYAKKAIYEQKTEIVVFEFEKFNSDFVGELEKLSKRYGISGYYYVTGETRLRRF